MLSHHIDQHQCTIDIIVVILPGLLNRFSHRLQAGKMNTGINVFFAEYVLKSLTIADIRFIERNLLSCDLFDPFETLFAGIAEIVDYHHIVPCILQFDHGMTSDKAHTTGYKNRHCLILLYDC